MAARRKLNAKGRNVGTQPFVMLRHWTFDCEAYRRLKTGPRALLWEFIRRHNGANNGYLAFSQRDMSNAINVADRQTVAGYVRILEEYGFITASRRGAFSVKVSDRRATEWTLTMFPVGEDKATKEFTRWTATENRGTEKPAAKGGKTVPDADEQVRRRPRGKENPSRQLGETRDCGTEKPSTYTF